MNLHQKLEARAAEGRPIRIGMIGAGKFGSMFLAQVRHTPGIHLMALADLNVERARTNLEKTGWEAERFGASGMADALAGGTTYVTDDALGMIGFDGLDIVIEATGDPTVGIRHSLAAFDAGHNVITVNVEADVLAGPLLAARAQQAGLIYSLAYGDQPAIICEHVDWARACGFEVVCAGKGTRYHPTFHASTPDTVWPNFGITAEMAERGGMNPKMFNSFIDGTKSGIEMSAVCNATGLTPQPDGLSFPPTPVEQLANTCRPEADGGTLSHSGTTEVVSSLNRDNTPVVNHLQMGTYVVVAAGHDYVRHCLEEYKMLPDDSFDHMAFYRPTHMIGLELGISVASIGLRGEATGAPTGFRADVVATAKRDLTAGEMLDGEGGYCVWGKQMPAADSLARDCLPLGLAGNVRLVRDVPQGTQVKWSDVEIDSTDLAVRTRREMEVEFASPPAAAAAE